MTSTVEVRIADAEAVTRALGELAQQRNDALRSLIRLRDAGRRIPTKGRSDPLAADFMDALDHATKMLNVASNVWDVRGIWPD